MAGFFNRLHTDHRTLQPRHRRWACYGGLYGKYLQTAAPCLSHIVLPAIPYVHWWNQNTLENLTYMNWTLPMFQKQADNISLVLVDSLLQECVPSRKTTFKLTKSLKSICHPYLRGRNCFEESSKVFLCFHRLPFLADQLWELSLDKVQGQLWIFLSRNLNWRLFASSGLCYKAGIHTEIRKECQDLNYFKARAETYPRSMIKSINSLQFLLTACWWHSILNTQPFDKQVLGCFGKERFIFKHCI